MTNLFAEVSFGLDTLAGGSVVGMLIAVMTAFMRRTKDVDERRDEAARMIMDAALEREARAWGERDKLQQALDVSRIETERVRNQLEDERRQWQDERRELQKVRRGGRTDGR